MNLWQEYWTPVRVFLGLGAEPQTLTFVQISLRGIIVFIFTLLMVRVSARRSLARRTVFDSVFLVILASVLARAINGSMAHWQLDRPARAKEHRQLENRVQAEEQERDDRRQRAQRLQPHGKQRDDRE